MSTNITAGNESITPTIVLGIEVERTGGTIVHPIVGRSNPDITLRPASLRRGTMTLGFQGPGSEQESQDALDVLASSTIFTLTSDERSTLAFPFVVSGTITRELDDESRDGWVVTAEYSEVAL